MSRTRGRRGRHAIATALLFCFTSMAPLLISASVASAEPTGTLYVWVEENYSWAEEPSSGLVEGPGIKCGSGFDDCTEEIAVGQSVTLTVTAGSGSYVHYVYDCTNGTTTCTKTISSGYN